MTPTHPLTQDQVDFFHREGYLAIDALTHQEEVATIAGLYDRMFAQHAGREEGNQFDLAGTDEDGAPAALPQILNPAKYIPELNETQLLVNADAVGKQLLGAEAHASFAHAIFKPAHHGAATPWHQDAAYWNPYAQPRHVSIWIPLQEADESNGCLHFVPGSQKMDLLEHQAINNDPRIHGLELTPDQMHHVEGAVACPLPPGGATFHGGFMLHHAPANRSDVPRRAIIITVRVPEVRLEVPRSVPWQENRLTARQDRAEAAQGSNP